MFNALVSLDVIDGAKVVDVYAGSGALGIEALSRGAATCTFIEHNGAAVRVIRDNVTALGLLDRARIVHSRAEAALATERDADLVLIDPPYDFQDWAGVLQIVPKVLAPGGVAVLESGRPLEDVIERAGGWEIVRLRKYGRTWVAFLQRSLS